jgi:hypothetical protein
VVDGLARRGAGVGAEHHRGGEAGAGGREAIEGESAGQSRVGCGRRLGPFSGGNDTGGSFGPLPARPRARAIRGNRPSHTSSRPGKNPIDPVPALSGFAVESL